MREEFLHYAELMVFYARLIRINHFNNIQLSPEGEVNSGGYIQCAEMQSVEVYIHRSSVTLRGIVVLVFTKSDG